MTDTAVWCAFNHAGSVVLTRVRFAESRSRRMSSAVAHALPPSILALFAPRAPIGYKPPISKNAPFSAKRSQLKCVALRREQLALHPSTVDPSPCPCPPFPTTPTTPTIHPPPPFRSRTTMTEAATPPYPTPP